VTPARRWAEGYRRAWEALDAEAAAALYAEDVVARSSPFREADLGRPAVLDYTRRVHFFDHPANAFFRLRFE